MKKSRVIVIEDDLALRLSLLEWLSNNYLVSGYESSESFLESINNLTLNDGIPTCILLDFQMPGANGVELQRTLKSLNITYPIIFMSGNAQQADVIDAWRDGAIDFILKPFTGTQVSERLNNIFLKWNESHSIAAKIEDKNIVDIPISPREAEVLSLLGQGLRQAEVAEILGLGLRTIKMHRASLKNKLNLNTPVDLTRFYDQHLSAITKLVKNK